MLTITKTASFEGTCDSKLDPESPQTQFGEQTCSRYVSSWSTQLDLWPVCAADLSCRCCKRSKTKILNFEPKIIFWSLHYWEFYTYGNKFLNQCVEKHASKQGATDFHVNKITWTHVARWFSTSVKNSYGAFISKSHNNQHQYKILNGCI